ncbi:MAG: hypothetical protein SGJ19_07725 [Planctomycetia bacterium]|mgnify:CR=1 FL=1|nr:hypothetical protein [Planctomycetia bacterium]
MPLRQPRRLVYLLIPLGWAAGCSTPPPLDMPDFADPGPAAYQQRRANRWDIYPETDSTASMDGARPREFVSSNPEPTRARWSFWPFSGQ